MRKSLTSLVSLFVGVIYSASLSAAEPTKAISVEELVSQTLASNPELAFYEAEIAAARSSRAIAGRQSNPELSLEVGGKKAGRGNGAAEGMAYSASLVQPIEWPGRIGLRKAIANRDIDLAELGLEQFKLHLAARVRVLAYSLAVQQDVASAANEVASRYTELRDVIVQRDAAGIAPMLETRTIEAATVVAQAKAAEASVEVQKALLEINQLMNRRADTPLQVLRPQFNFAEMPALETLLLRTTENHYELRIRRAELEQQGFKVDLAKNERYPTLSVGPFVSQEEADERERVAGIGVSLPLQFWNGKANVGIAESRRVQAQATLSAAQREAERQVTESALLFRTLSAQMKNWKVNSLSSFREAADLADRHYRLGAVPISTYIELQDKYLEATEAINQTQTQALEAALTLEQLTGAPNSLVQTLKPIP